MTAIDSSAVPSDKAAGEKGNLGLSALTAVVIGSMIGSGVFNLPQNMAAGAGPLAIIIGWAISGVGILALALVYQGLSTRKPQLNSGPYAYAKAGFGPFIGFNSAWGYWLSAWIGNVSYAVVMFSALSYFFPFFGEGNTWQSLIGASAVLWAIHWLILSGVRQAAFINIITTIAKVVPILLFIAVVVVAFRINVFTLDFSGMATPELGSVLDQVRSTMLVTLWVFIGIEGASVVSGRARKRRDIGLATFAGFVTTLSIYALVSLLSLGVMSRPELAGLKNPSMAGVLEHVVGSWGAILISVALVVSVLGAFLAWTLLAAEVPYVASRDGTMPKFFGGENKSGAPATSLWITNGLVQLFLVLTLLANSTYLALLYIASTAILVPYIFSGAYALKLALTGEAYAPGERRTRDLIAGGVATLYGVWLVYAAGPTYLLMAAMLYAPGIIIYVWARRENGQKTFTIAEMVMAAGLVIAGVVAAYLIWNGTISPL
ncbi:arginine-ornithine antiporter [Devosia sp.]|uniref:arginine-ornithine antiporter n=1 Tax=Devosia sp. TaxID=1871048 RepID=UPI003263B83C